MLDILDMDSILNALCYVVASMSISGGSRISKVTMRVATAVGTKGPVPR
jgi:hypothetical protein